MLQTLDTTDGDGPIWELYPSVATVGAVYGDPDKKYASFLKAGDNTYPAEPYFLWNQPLSDSDLAAATPTSGSTPTSTPGAGAKTGGAVQLGRGIARWAGVVVSVSSIGLLLG
jgi:hypothetical protein